MRYGDFDICEVRGREILDSRGNPTVEAEVFLENGACGRAAVPSGASTGSHEAAELRDGGLRYGGRGVKRAAENINDALAEKVLYESALNQAAIDRLLVEADGSKNKGNLGANAILAVSLATARAAADGLGLPLYRYLGGAAARKMPVPMMNILNGGRHADNTLDLQEFMIMPWGAENFAEGLRICTEVYHTLKRLLKERGMSTAVGDEGGFAPDIKDAAEALSLMTEAVKLAGFAPGRDVRFALDAAASELFDPSSGRYLFPGESRAAGRPVSRSAAEMIACYESLAGEFAVCSLEDGLSEDDWDGWRQMTERLGGRIQLVGDDLFVTDPERIRTGAAAGAANAVLIKMNQIGTLSETFDAVEVARAAGYRTVISHRSGETEDSFIADLAVALNAGQIKTGAPCRSDRTAKYNRLLRIEEDLG